MTFGGRGMFAKAGIDGRPQGRGRMIDMAVDAGVNMLDTANVYSSGDSEAILGEALGEGRDRVLIASKARFGTGDGPNDRGLSRWHLIRACEDSLRRLRTDRIDLYQMHEWDGVTPLEETMEALDTLIRAGKVRYVGCSNFSAWHIMKSQGVAERHGYQRLVSQQIHYTLQAREAEYELVPVALDQGVGILVWSRWRAGCCRGNTGAISRRRKAGTCRNGTSRRCATRDSYTTSSMRSWRSARRAASRRRRWRSRGCWRVRA